MLTLKQTGTVVGDGNNSPPCLPLLLPSVPRQRLASSIAGAKHKKLITVMWPVLLIRLVQNTSTPPAHPRDKTFHVPFLEAHTSHSPHFWLTRKSAGWEHAASSPAQLLDTTKDSVFTLVLWNSCHIFYHLQAFSCFPCYSPAVLLMKQTEVKWGFFSIALYDLN